MSGSLIEKHSIEYVPLAERHGKVWHLWPVWFSGDAHLATLAVGAIGGSLGGNLLWSALAVIGGCALGTFFMAFHSTQGPQLGLPQMIQSRPQFGYLGALLVWSVALVTYIGFTAFNQLLAAQALHQLVPAIPPTSRAVIVGLAVLATALAALGYDKIHLAQRGFAYVMIAILAVFSVAAALRLRLPPGALNAGDFRAVPFIAQFFAAASYQLSWSIYVSDYSRYLPRDVGVRASFWWTFLGAFVGGAWMMLVGTLAAGVAPRVDVAAALQACADRIAPGLGVTLLLGAVTGLIAISALNFYGASLTLVSVADSLARIERKQRIRIASLLASALIATVIALESSSHFIDRFGDLLAVLLYLFTPWTAINLVDFYLVRRGHYSVRQIFDRHGMYGSWNWRGLTAYAIGFMVMIPCFSTGLYRGPVARALAGADVSMLVGLPVAAAVYLLACRSMDLTADRQQAAAADAGLDG
ncbi:MAG TPA: cytosine permease [Steroidobacteraceae bacterium]|nr:cytosine permease [Steroidobacteraceae bacterium]